MHNTIFWRSVSSFLLICLALPIEAQIWLSDVRVTSAFTHGTRNIAVRPGDTVRHLVPKAGPTKLLILWSPSGEAAKGFPPGVKGVTPEPVAEAKSLDP